MTEYYVKDDTGDGYTEASLPSMQDQIPEDLREADHFKDIEDVGQLVTRYHEASTAAKPEGAPEKYELGDVLKDVPFDESLLEVRTNMYKDLGFTQTVAERLVKHDVEEYRQRQEQNSQAFSEAIKTVWKEDEIEGNLENADKTLRMMTTEQGYQHLQQYMADPAFAVMLHNLSKVYGERALTGGDIRPAPSDDNTDPETGETMLTFPNTKGMH